MDQVQLQEETYTNNLHKHCMWTDNSQFTHSLTIVPLPLIFRPDFDTAGFWSAETDDSSFSTLQRSNINT